MKNVILLVMHGVPPNDFPPDELNEYFGLAGRIRRGTPTEREALRERQQELETKMRDWPRNVDNDPFYFASRELAENVARTAETEVRLAFNEFCAPDIDTAIEEAIADGATRIVVATTMMTRGGGHSEMEINNSIATARQKHPETEIVYAWPYETAAVARFLAGHVRRFM